MKKILITGANSFIGTSFENYILSFNEGYEIHTLDMQKENWSDSNFLGYDVVFHVAGIAHVDVGNADEVTKAKYYEVNTNLAVEVAEKAKLDGVKQFIFMSSSIVYGDSAPMGKSKVITRDTKPQPANFYGDSKLQAEKGIETLKDLNFKTVILRPPMIYGEGSKGNYVMLVKLAKKLPIFPNIKNERSMLSVDNLCEFVKCMIDNEECGIFHPQDKEYVCTSQMVKGIAKSFGKDIYLTSLLNPFVMLASKMPGKVGALANKAFGNFTYDMELSRYEHSDN